MREIHVFESSWDPSCVAYRTVSLTTVRLQETRLLGFGIELKTSNTRCDMLRFCAVLEYIILGSTRLCGAGLLRYMDVSLRTATTFEQF